VGWGNIAVFRQHRIVNEKVFAGYGLIGIAADLEP
jgi:hypothetical protein